jgi:uncharacterized protein YidB (DUF937 family)
MGLFDEVKNAATSMLAGNAAASPVVKSVLDLLGQGGGISGLVQNLQQKGLGDIVGSWVSTGPNLPIDAQQVNQALGGHVQRLAAQHGMSPELASQALAQVLPGLVDQLTPGGQMPTGPSLEQGLSALRSKFGL